MLEWPHLDPVFEITETADKEQRVLDHVAQLEVVSRAILLNEDWNRIPRYRMMHLAELGEMLMEVRAIGAQRYADPYRDRVEALERTLEAALLAPTADEPAAA